MEWSSEAGAADWIVARLHPFAADVGSFVPEGLEADARVLHPLWRVDQGRGTRVRWAEVALYLGGTRALVEEVLGDGRLEAVPARLTDPVHG